MPFGDGQGRLKNREIVKYKVLQNKGIEINAFPFYFFVNDLREVRNMSKLLLKRIEHDAIYA